MKNICNIIRTCICSLTLVSAQSIWAANDIAPGVSPAAPTETAKPVSYQYSPSGKPDPFKPISFAAAPAQDAGQLATADLRDLKLVGTALGSEMSAIIMSGGTGLVARVGDKIGRQGGRVVSIATDKIIVRQPLASLDGSGASGSKGTRQRFEDVTISLVQQSINVAPKSNTGSSQGSSGYSASNSFKPSPSQTLLGGVPQSIPQGMSFPRTSLPASNSTLPPVGATIR